MPRPLRNTREIAESIRGNVPVRAARPQTRSLESAYMARIREIITEYRELAETEILAILDFIAAPQPPRFDDPSDVIERTFGDLRVRVMTLFDKRRLTRMASDMALKVDTTNRDQFRRMIRTVLKVDPLQTEPWLLEEVGRFVRENVSLIRSIPEESLADIEQMLYRDAARRLSPQEMRAKIRDRFQVSESRAELIATDQVLKFNGSLTELRQKSIGVQRYIWRTAEDQRVRGNPAGRYPDAKPSHYDLNGKVFSWDKPPVSGTRGERLHPGQPIRCRCYAEPIFEKS